MRNIRPLTAISLCFALVFTTVGFTDCGKAPTKTELEGYAGNVVSGLNTARPFVARARPTLLNEFDELHGIATRFEAAVKEADSELGTDLLGDLIDRFDTIVPKLADNTIVLIALEVVNVALRYLAAKYETHVDAGTGSAVAGDAKIRAYGRRKPWRCRAAGAVILGEKNYKAGQYVPMEACKKFPDTTTVETR